MGIPSYFAHIVRKHRKIIKKINTDSPKINNLYLDCNSFIYEAHQILVNSMTEKQKKLYDQDVLLFEKDLINLAQKNLIKLVEQLKPENRILIAFDGVAPLAKLDQQRNRRYMSAFQSSIDAENPQSSGALKYKWNTSAITPGTDFMEKLGKEFSIRFRHPKEFGVEIIMVSTSCEAGEGEHKIYDYIRTNAAYHKETYTVIYGLDADLIMLTLNHLHISENMFLFRETPEFIKSIDKTLNPSETYFLDIPLFARSIIKEMSCENANKPVDEISVQNDVLFDYIFMCFFLGNDFLPHFPALNIRTSGINRLIDTYKAVFKHDGDTLTKDHAIVWKNVRRFLNEFSTNELDYVKEEYGLREKSSKRAMYDNNDADDMNLIPLKDRAVEIYINPNEVGWESRYYQALFATRINDDRRKEISTNFLEGLEWTFKYYSTGCADWRWSYKYNYPPLFVDLIKYVPYFDTTLVALKEKQPVSPMVQLSYVLPPSSMVLLPPALKEKLLKEKPEWYVGNYIFHWAFCKFFWEAHVDLPDINIAELEKVVCFFSSVGGAQISI
jgi:5'-3' exoribonuclease 1